MILRNFHETEQVTTIQLDGAFVCFTEVCGQSLRTRFDEKAQESAPAAAMAQIGFITLSKEGFAMNRLYYDAYDRDTRPELVTSVH